MTLRLILIRHAKSDWSTPGMPDHDRPLNARGRMQAPLIGKWLASRHDLPGQVLCSDETRTVETLTLILAELPEAPAVTITPALYHAPALMMLDALKGQTAPVVMLVGHNPGIAELAGSLVHTPSLHARFSDYPTGATTVIDWGLTSWAEVEIGSGAVRDFIVPDDLTD